MTETLPIHVSRNRSHTIEAATQSFETAGSFTVALENHGAAKHVHLHLDDDLSTVATLGSGNYYVEEDSIKPVTVTVEGGGRPVEGRLKAVTGYGSNAAYVTVRIVDASANEHTVEVDESLSVPQSDERPTNGGVDLPGVENAPVVALGGIALVIAVAAAVSANSPAILLGVVAVLGGVLAAAYFLLI